jgi:putative hemolysin
LEIPINTVLSSLNLVQISLIISQLSQSAIIVNIIIIAILIVCSALMASAEVAFFSLTSKEITLLRKKYVDSANSIIILLEQPRKLLATILIANNFFNIGIVIASYAIIRGFIDFDLHPVLGFIIEIVVVTFVLVLFGEVLPKIYAAQHNIRVALFMALPIGILTKIFSPLSRFLISFTNIIEQKLINKHSPEADTDEINHAIDIALHDKTTKQEMSILKGIANFGNISVKQIMRSRTDIVAIDYHFSFKQLIQFVKEMGYSRIPVFDDDIDTIKGVLFSKDLISYLQEKENFDWHFLIKETLYIPEQKKINDLLKEFQKERMHQAIVVDEFGGTAGLVTLEDIMEEIIGDIKDEFDETDELFSKVNDFTFIFDGKAMLNDVCKILHMPVETFDEIKGEADTIAGLVLELCGKIPKPSDQVKFKQFEFTVIQMHKMRISKIKATIIKASTTDAKP